MIISHIDHIDYIQYLQGWLVLMENKDTLVFYKALLLPNLSRKSMYRHNDQRAYIKYLGEREKKDGELEIGALKAAIWSHTKRRNRGSSSTKCVGFVTPFYRAQEHMCGLRRTYT